MEALRENLTIETIWEKYNQLLRNFIARRVKKEPETDDILQEVFIKIHLNISKLKDLEKLRAWIFQIARNAIVDYYRKSKYPDELEESKLTGEFSIDNDPYFLLSKSIKAMIDLLPGKYSEALIYTYCYGISQKELSEILNISFSTARSRVQRAKKKLRELYIECCRFELDNHGNIIDYYPRCSCRNYN